MPSLDERLEDRHLPFLDKLVIAQSLLESMKTAADLECLAEWTFSTLLKLSKAANPRGQVFTADPLWTFIHSLLERCFPADKRPLLTRTACRHGRVHCRQPMLPAFVCFGKLWDGAVATNSYTMAFNKMFDLFKSNRMELNGQLQNIVELCHSLRRFKELADKSVLMLLRLYERQDTKKAFSYLLTALPEVISFDASDETVSMTVKFLLTDTVGKNVLSNGVQEAIVKMPVNIQIAFLQSYLTAVKTNAPLDEYRRTGFAICRHFITASPPDTHKWVIDVMNELNVYVHKNDEIYAEQQSFLSDLLPSITSVSVVAALLDLDFYLILSQLDKLSMSLLSEKLFHLSLYRHAVSSRQLDDVIKALRHKRVGADQDALFEALLSVDRLLIRHYEESVGVEAKDGYWVVLLYLCGFETDVFESKLRGAECAAEEEIVRLLRFYDPLHIKPQDTPNSLAFVPEMSGKQFAKYIGTLELSDIMKMLESPVFYELSQLQKPFEQWLLAADSNVQKTVLSVCPSDYLSNTTIKQLLSFEECVRMVKRRPTVIKHILKNISSLYPLDLLKVAARFAVKAGRFVDEMMKDYCDLVLQVRPINPSIADTIMQYYRPDNYLFIPYILLQQPNGLEKYPITDPTAPQHYPYLYNVRLADVQNATIEMIREYPFEEQLAYLQTHGHLTLQMLQDKRCRMAAVAHVRQFKGKVDTAVIDCLVQLTKDVPYDDWLHQLALRHPNHHHHSTTTLHALSLHRPQCLEPRFIVDYTSALLNLPTDDDDAFCKIMSALLQRRGSRVVDEAVLVLLVHHVNRVEVRAESRVGEVLRRMGKRVEAERAMALLSDDGKSRLRDLLSY